MESEKKKSEMEMQALLEVDDRMKKRKELMRMEWNKLANEEQR